MSSKILKGIFSPKNWVLEVGNNNEKRGRKFEEGLEGVYGMTQRGKGEGRNRITMLKIKLAESIQ